jgi:hypothetical protein
MGIYIDPPNREKEAFLAEFGQGLTLDAAYEHDCDTNREQVLVCLVDNFAFTAAGVCFSNREKEAFASPDGRPRRWYLVPLDSLNDAAGLGEDFPQKYRNHNE